MARAARVTSLDSLREFKTGLGEFADDARRAVIEAEQDVSRTLAWLQSDALAYWQAEIRRRTEQVNKARMELSQKRYTTEESGGSIVDERKALKRAEERLEVARQKLERTRHWSRELEREAMLFKGQLQQLMASVEQDMPNAIALMNRLIESVEAYLVERAPDTQQSPSHSDAAESAGFTSPPDPSRAAGPRLRSRDHQRYLALREQAPDESARRRLRMADQAESIEAGERLHDEDVAAIDQLPGDRDDPDPRSRVVVERGALAAGPWAALRLEPSTRGDSGWVIIRADRTEPPDAESCESLSVLRLRDQRPDLRGVLCLAEGAVCVVETGQADGGRLVAVINDRDEVIWPT